MQHATEFIGCAQEIIDRPRRGHADPFGEDQVRFQFLERPLGDPQEIQVGWLPRAGASASISRPTSPG